MSNAGHLVCLYTDECLCVGTLQKRLGVWGEQWRIPAEFPGAAITKIWVADNKRIVLQRSGSGWGCAPPEGSQQWGAGVPPTSSSFCGLLWTGGSHRLPSVCIHPWVQTSPLSRGHESYRIRAHPEDLHVIRFAQQRPHFQTRPPSEGREL